MGYVFTFTSLNITTRLFGPTWRYNLNVFIEPRLYSMLTSTSLKGQMAPLSSISLKAEIALLLIITIFGIIGLSFCMGSYDYCNEFAVDSNNQDIELAIYDR